jgi:methyl-galactoside transport system permease protein
MNDLKTNDLKVVRGNSTKKILNFVTQNAIFICLAVLILFIIAWDPRFLSFTVLRDILVQVSTRSIIALGAAFVLITAGCDLSAGRMVGFAAVLSGSMLQTQEYTRRFFPNMQDLPLWLPILIAIAVALLFGLLNGFVVSKLSVPPFIATLATTTIIYGINSLYVNLPPNESQPIAGFRSDFTFLGSGYVFGIPVIILIAIAVLIITWVILNKTRFGKNVYAIGGNINAAKVSGINVDRTLMKLYAYAGALYGLAGVLEAARTGGSNNNYGVGYELDAIAACVVGGVSLMGGIGTVSGIIAGVLIFGVINYGLTFVGMSPYWQQIIKGIIIVVAVSFDIRKYLTKK